MIRLIPAAALLLASQPAAAAERGYTVTSFDRVRVEGGFSVSVTSNRGPSVRADGSPAALDEMVVRVDGRTLVLRRNSRSWGGYPGEDHGSVSFVVTVPQLVSASLTGSGTLTIDAMRAPRVDLVADGSGRLRVERVQTDHLAAATVGSGTITLAGQVAEARVIVRGAGALDGEGLTAIDANVVADGSGTVRLAARRTASVQASGSGTVAISGTPACTVRNQGSGEVRCGAAHR